MGETETKNRAREIAAKAVNGVLMTVDEHGFPHPRTMWTAGIDDDFTTYFVTGRPLEKCKQIAANPKVCIYWTGTEGEHIGWSYVLLKGEATVTDDQALRDRFWNGMLAQYYPAGKVDPNYVVIVVKPKTLMLMDSHKYPLDKVEFS
jgi:general stress protein 26